MKKQLSLFISISFISFLSVHAQNNEINAAVQVNTDQQSTQNNVQVSLGNGNENMQDVALNTLGNNPPSNIINTNLINTNIAVQQQTQVQVQTTTTSQDVASVSVGSSGRRSTASYSSSASFSSSRSHAFKMNLHIHIGRVHIARKFFHEFPVFQAKTYKHIFKGKNKSFKKCFHF
jgi:hypothetical protein